jgi:hypothetical protein
MAGQEIGLLVEKSQTAHRTQCDDSSDEQTVQNLRDEARCLSTTNGNSAKLRRGGNGE